LSEEQDDGPLLCSRGEKAAREAANGVAQIDYLTELVTGNRASKGIRESHLLQLQQLAIDGIYPCGGTYRDARTTIVISDSLHVPPPAALVPSHVVDLVEYVNSTRDTIPALERAAYALWRLNWIHPFRGGNGRTSRCFAYLILCQDLGLMMPGVPSLPTLIYERRHEYVQALKAADASQRALDRSEEQGEKMADLSFMTEYLRDLVTRQLASAIEKLARRS
jgi:Fic family protein